MKKVIKQVVGIDVSSKHLDVCFMQESADGQRTIKGTKRFSNTYEGFRAYLSWCRKRKKACEMFHVMEATGVYHENLCYFLFEHQEKVSVQLAQKIKYFGKSLNQKTKTDKKDSTIIAKFGFSYPLALWAPLSGDFKDIRDLCRVLAQLKGSRAATKSRLSALESKHNTAKDAKQILKSLIKELDKKATQCEEKIMTLTKRDKDFYKKLTRICAIKGVGMLTVIKLLAETDGFRRFSGIRKLVSYAGLDVVEHQSGDKVGRTKISKKGNAYIREALYMPALSACHHNANLCSFYQRLQTRQNTNKQGVVAVMRKLLVLIYTLWKSEQEYEPNYVWTGGRNLNNGKEKGRA